MLDRRLLPLTMLLAVALAFAWASTVSSAMVRRRHFSPSVHESRDHRGSPFVSKTIPLIRRNSTVYANHARKRDGLTKSSAAWAAQMIVGADTILLDLDSGSSNLVLQGDAYSPSSHSVNLGKTLEVRYGYTASDAYTLDLYTDIVSLAGISGDAIPFGVIQDGKRASELSTYGGLAGVGLPDSAAGDEPGFLRALHDAAGWESYSYSLDLTSSGGSLSLDVPQGVSWTLLLDGATGWDIAASLNGRDFYCNVDSGTYGIEAPLDVLRSLAEEWGGGVQQEDDGFYTLYTPCDSSPSATFTIGGADITLSKESFFINAFGEGANGDTCTSAFFGQDGSDQDFWGIGAPLFLDAVVAFDIPGRRLGVKAK